MELRAKRANYLVREAIRALNHTLCLPALHSMNPSRQSKPSKHQCHHKAKNHNRSKNLRIKLGAKSDIDYAIQVSTTLSMNSMQSMLSPDALVSHPCIVESHASHPSSYNREVCWSGWCHNLVLSSLYGKCQLYSYQIDSERWEREGKRKVKHTLVDISLGVVGSLVLLVDDGILGGSGTAAQAGIAVLRD